MNKKQFLADLRNLSDEELEEQIHVFMAHGACNWDGYLSQNRTLAVYLEEEEQ